MKTRPGMSCTDNRLTEDVLHKACANDDDIDPYSAADLMGVQLWALYCERWNPERFVPEDISDRRRAAG